MDSLQNVGRGSSENKPKSKYTPSIPDNGVPANAPCQCPYCRTKTTATAIEWTSDKWICKCDNGKCGKTFFADVEYNSAIQDYDDKITLYFDILATYPKVVAEKHVSIPENIWADYAEASNCFNADSYKATVVMCRRTLQNVGVKKGATKKYVKGGWIPLKEQIKSAFPQKEYPLINQLTDAIKFLGDYGGHPNDDGIDQVTKEDAETILDFTFQILKIVFIQQWEIQKILDKKTASKK
ncbi:MAG: DUF4145 domain-containing protein [Candidatus Bathyarchaeota archaeon]|nr:DUF4145 domain-containing protein [Candidatus Bathyarchaeota archaeon]